MNKSVASNIFNEYNSQNQLENYSPNLTDLVLEFNSRSLEFFYRVTLVYSSQKAIWFQKTQNISCLDHFSDTFKVPEHTFRSLKASLAMGTKLNEKRNWQISFCLPQAKESQTCLDQHEGD